MNFNRDICRYYLQGTCWFGDYCRFSHDVPDDSSDSDDDLLDFSRPNMTMFNARDSGRQMISRGSQAGRSSVGSDRSNEALHGAVGGQYRDELRRDQSSSSQLCTNGDRCRYRKCKYLHGEYCYICGQFRLHPTDLQKRTNHINECKDREIAIAFVKSEDKTCGICFDIIMEKSEGDQKFGILPNCNHVFCYDCIRKWRQEKQFEHKGCPECRTQSDYVCPSDYFAETKELKDKIISDYKAALSEKDCRYFQRRGRGRCPFGNECFYRHALPNGVRVDIGPPRRKINASDEDVRSLVAGFVRYFLDDERN